MTNYSKTALIFVIVTTSLNASDQHNATEMLEIARQEFKKISNLTINQGDLSAPFVRNLALLLQESEPHTA